MNHNAHNNYVDNNNENKKDNDDDEKIKIKTMMILIKTIITMIILQD